MQEFLSFVLGMLLGVNLCVFTHKLCNDDTSERRLAELQEAVRTMLATMSNCEISSNSLAMLTYLRARAAVDALVGEG